MAGALGPRDGQGLEQGHAAEQPGAQPLASVAVHLPCPEQASSRSLVTEGTLPQGAPSFTTRSRASKPEGGRWEIHPLPGSGAKLS